MTFDDYRASLKAPAPPDGLSLALQGLWWDAHDDWSRAHNCAQDDEGREAAWVHAYLHRKEGDLGNAGYWYRRAGQTMPSGTLDSEWTMIAEALLKA